MTLHAAGSAAPSIADAIALLNRMPVDARDLVLAACSKARGGEAAPMPTPFDAAHPPAGWRSIREVPPIGVLTPIFTSPYWAERFKRGADVQIYSATCRGLKQLSLALGRKTPKIGSCGVGQFEGRLQSLGRDRYGAVRRDGHANVHEEGFSSYEHMDQLKIATQPPACPVRNSSYGLVVTMPRGWRRQQFDLRFNLALRPFRLTAFADSLEGRGICTARGVPVERLIRFSNCSRNGLAGADEILVMEPFQDGARLATVMALVVVQHVAPDLVPENLRKLVPRVGASANDPALV